MHHPDKKMAPAGRYFGHGEFQRKPGAVLPLAHRFPHPADNSCLSRLQVAPQIAIVGAAIRLRHQHGHVSPNRLVRPVLEQPQRGRVQRLNDAGAIDGNNPIQRALDHRGKAGFAFAQRLFGLLAGGDVQEYANRAAHLAKFPEQRQGIAERIFAASLVETELKFSAQPPQLAAAAARCIGSSVAESARPSEYIS